MSYSQTPNSLFVVSHANELAHNLPPGTTPPPASPASLRRHSPAMASACRIDESMDVDEFIELCRATTSACPAVVACLYGERGRAVLDAILRRRLGCASCPNHLGCSRVAKSPSAVSALLAVGADLNAYDAITTATPVRAAIEADSPDALSLLLDAGADIYSKVAHESVLFGLSYRLPYGEADIYEILADAGFDFTGASPYVDRRCYAVMMRAGARLSCWPYDGIPNLPMIRPPIEDKSSENAIPCRAATVEAVDPFFDEAHLSEIVGDYIYVPHDRFHLYQRERDQVRAHIRQDRLDRLSACRAALATKRDAL